MSPPVSAIVIAKDAAATLAEVLAQLSWAGEMIVVVDAASSDGTEAIARAGGARVFARPWPGFVAQKLFAIEQTTYPWVLWVDADEVLAPALAHEIVAAVACGEAAGYLLPRRHVFLGRALRYGGTYPDYQLRLFRKEAGHFDAGSVHELVTVDGAVGTLRAPMLHYSTPSIQSRVDRINRYTELDSEASPAALRAMLVEPARRFWTVYLRRLGFLDGVPGLLWAVFSAFESFLRAAKSWEKQAQASESRP